jgi:pyrroloquinoline quinone (PQQ) biosynthesis protein C
VLLKRSPPEGEAFFRTNIPVERRHGTMWRAMGAAFGVPPQCFEGYIPSNPTVNAFHNFLTDIGANAPFASAVAATNYAVESQGREWLMEHATCDDEHAIVAMELVKTCWKGGDAELNHIRDSALRSTQLLRDAMDESYHM